MPTYVNGSAGVAKSGATDLNVTHWKATPRNGVIETTNTSTSGNETYIAGISGMDVSVDAFFDTTMAASPFDNPPNLIPGQIVTMTLQIGGTTQKFNASVIIESVDVDSEVHGAVKYTMNGKTTGAVTFPT